MALRVLLADESSTIKKVMQLTLQDFDVDVRSVSVGLDVLSVAKSFKPDVIFADVLLAKRSGYEVCHDLKNDPETQKVPVILMWSGFMEIDEQKARLCGADRRLEKPFDPSGLRELIQDLVRKTRDNPVSSFIQFPPLPEFQEAAQPPQQQAPTPKVEPEVALPQEIPRETSSIGITIDDTEGADEWVQQPPPKATPKDPTHVMAPPADEFAEFPLTSPAHIQSLSQQVANQISPQVKAPGVDTEMIRSEIQKWLSINMAPLAEKIIREEINRLLQDSEQTIEAP